MIWGSGCGVSGQTTELLEAGSTCLDHHTPQCLAQSRHSLRPSPLRFLGSLPHHFAPAWEESCFPTPLATYTLAGSDSASCLPCLWLPTPSFTQAFPAPPLWALIAWGPIMPLMSSPALSSLCSPASPCQELYFSFLQPWVGVPCWRLPPCSVAQGQPHCPVLWTPLLISFLFESALECP